MKATLFTCDGDEEKIELRNFSQAKEIVCEQGYNSNLELVRLNNNRALIIDEEGKLKNLSINSKATSLAHEDESIYPSDWICGDVILIDDLDEFDLLPYGK